MTASVEYPQLRLGTAPDSWGVWNPGLDPLQTPWTRYLDEVQAAGYRYSELGPYGYLPTDPGVIRDEYAKRGLTLTGGTVFVALHKGKDALAQAKADCDAEMATIGPLGARHLVILPEGYTDFDGNLTASPTLTDDEWTALTSGMSELGRYVADEHGAVLVFHTHADSNVGTQEEIARFLDRTDPATVRLCLDTGHVAYCGADNLAHHPRLPERASATSTSSRSTRRSGSACVDERLGFAPAVRLGVMVEPPLGDPDMPAVLAALGGARPGPVLHRRAGPVPVRPDRPAADRDPDPRVLRGTAGSTWGDRPATSPHLPTEGVDDHPRRGHRHGRHRDRPRPQARPRHLRVHAWRPSRTSTGPAPQQVAAEIGGATVFDDGYALIESDDVDAVLIASIAETHAAFTLACIAAGKPVLCEKPLAPTTAECEQVLEAEVALGRRLVIVGFMRRQDPGYRQVKASLDGGAIGDALILHNVHRNPTVPDSFTSFMTMTDSIIHEIDTSRWLLGEELASVQVIPPRRTAHAAAHLQDPQFAVFTTESGVLVTAEFFANCQYGYDVRCELVGSEGTASLVNPVVAAQVTAGIDARPSGAQLAGPVRRRLRRRAAGVDQRPGAGRDRRPERLGRLRGDPGHRVRRRGGELRRAPRHRLHGQARAVSVKVALDPYMFRTTPLLELPALVAELGYEHIELSPREDFIPFFTAPARGRGDDQGVPDGARRRRRRGGLAAAAVPLVGSRRGRARRRAVAVLEAVDRDRGRARA